ncbi:carboxypeptidase A5-like isoform X1 [Notamacropus eugenii]|uniref:carboxypeptidase A5-like isoform X1 n=1 Tax=Notamacropus eugenii TaxID=9315 RepID=UPI003B674724
MLHTPGGDSGPALLWLTMKSLLIVSLLLASTWSQKMFSGDQVLRIKAKDEKQLQLLRNLEDSEHLKVDFWHAPARPSLPVDMRVPFSNLKAVKNYLNSRGISYTIMIEDVQVLLDEERRGMTASRRQERSTSSFRYNSYHTLEEIYTWMDNFVVEHSNLVSKIMIGQTFENRPIFVLKFSTGNKTRPAIWIDSGIHAREWISQAVGVWTAMKIATDYGEEPVLTKVLNHMDIFLEVITNPDGFAYTHSMNRLWRKNRGISSNSTCKGVDPNRNWDSGFGAIPRCSCIPMAAGRSLLMMMRSCIVLPARQWQLSPKCMELSTSMGEPSAPCIWPTGSLSTGLMTMTSNIHLPLSFGTQGFMASYYPPVRSSPQRKRPGQPSWPSLNMPMITPTSNSRYSHSLRKKLLSLPNPGLSPEPELFLSFVSTSIQPPLVLSPSNNKNKF